MIRDRNSVVGTEKDMKDDPPSSATQGGRLAASLHAPGGTAFSPVKTATMKRRALKPGEPASTASCRQRTST
jgi:hypothetical protein